MEDRGIDEVYIDFTDVPGGQLAGGRVLARQIQKNVFDATGLTCSIGVAPNKLLAKMASTLDEISGGRLILGIGAGWHQPEFDAFGVPFDHRGARFQEAVEIIRPLGRRRG